MFTSEEFPRSTLKKASSVGLLPTKSLLSTILGSLTFKKAAVTVPVALKVPTVAVFVLVLPAPNTASNVGVDADTVSQEPSDFKNLSLPAELPLGTKPTDEPVNVDTPNSIVSVVEVLRFIDTAPRPSKNTLLDAPGLPSSNTVSYTHLTLPTIYSV